MCLCETVKQETNTHMILKIESVPGLNVAHLVAYIHSNENRAFPEDDTNKQSVIDIKVIEAQKPQNSEDPTTYRVTLELSESRASEKGGIELVNPKYLMRAYKILMGHLDDPSLQSGENLSAEQQSASNGFNDFHGMKIPLEVIHEPSGKVLLSADQEVTYKVSDKLVANIHHLNWKEVDNHDGSSAGAFIRHLERIRERLK
jgi:hypothetical protein